MPTFAVHYVYDDRTDVRDATRAEHRRYLSGLLDQGFLLASGPFVGPVAGSAGTQPDGALLLVRANSALEVQALLDEDPFARVGVISDRSIRGWEPVFGPWS